MENNQPAKNECSFTLKLILIAIVVGIILTGTSLLITRERAQYITHGYPLAYSFIIIEDYNYGLGMVEYEFPQAYIWGAFIDVLFWSVIIYVILVIIRKFRRKKSGVSGDKD